MRFTLQGYDEKDMQNLKNRMDNSYTINEDYCWEWNLSRNPGGYGKVKFAGKTLTAHRLYYQLIHGPVPSKLVVDHLCENRSCINPDHLEPVEQRENNARGLGVSAENLRKTMCKNGHEFTDENTLIGNNRRDCRTCKRMSSHNSDIKRTLRYHSLGLNSKGKPMQRQVDYRFK